MTLQIAVLLFLAIFSEVVGTISLKLSEGFTHTLPSIVFGIGYAAAFYLLSLVLKQGAPIGTAYAIWAGVGTIGATMAGVIIWQDKLNLGIVAGIALIVLGVILLNVFSTAHAG